MSGGALGEGAAPGRLLTVQITIQPFLHGGGEIQTTSQGKEGHKVNLEFIVRASGGQGEIGLGENTLFRTGVVMDVPFCKDPS